MFQLVPQAAIRVLYTSGRLETVEIDESDLGRFGEHLKEQRLTMAKDDPDRPVWFQRTVWKAKATKRSRKARKARGGK